jgi:hypothetical protein
MEQYYAIIRENNQLELRCPDATSKEKAVNYMNDNYNEVVRVLSKAELNGLKRKLKFIPAELDEVDKYILKNVLKSKSKYVC